VITAARVGEKARYTMIPVEKTEVGGMWSITYGLPDDVRAKGFYPVRVNTGDGRDATICTKLYAFPGHSWMHGRAVSQPGPVNASSGFRNRTKSSS
jgi:hypothetical protein